MKFIDSAIIHLQAGDGGKGCISFRREKWVPRGGPDGGNGGKGGDIYLVVRDNLTTLMDLQYQKHFKVRRGQGGKGKCQDGRGSDDIEIGVPPGTIVYDEETAECLGDLTENGMRLLVAAGGRGGKGNAFFKTSTQQAPRFSQAGEEGQIRTIRLELKLLADVGLVGLPNAGKSTFLASVSKARPKIADYPFTTLSPVLGVVVPKSNVPFTIADIPGLIEGAHEGAGLGVQFLKHVERTQIFLHLVSLSPDEQESPEDRYQTILKELKAFGFDLKKRKMIVGLTKLDLLEGGKIPKGLKTFFAKKKIPCMALSAVTRMGTQDVIEKLAEAVHGGSKKSRRTR